MDINKIHTVYFIGIGGIGMSALARYFNFQGKAVSGYDRTRTSLTITLEKEGLKIHYEDSVQAIPKQVLESPMDDLLIIYTPAIPSNHTELNYFKNKGYKIYKRSEILGILSKNKKGIAVAGTHGKTTVSTHIAHILKQSKANCSAFLGGISNNYQTNFLFSKTSPYMVLEADEYDRSFLQLYPYISVVTSMDPDHLDIYGDFDTMKENFSLFVSQTLDTGRILYRKGIDLQIGKTGKPEKFSYSLNEKADFFATNIRFDNYIYTIDLVTPAEILPDLQIGFTGYINIENTVASAAVAWLLNISKEEIRKGVQTYQGVKRRFDHRFISDKVIYIDDYAHHPRELEACIDSVKKLYPGRKILGVFQPHLYSRTRDFADAFADTLDSLDEIILVDLYPAREEPIAGVSSALIFDRMRNPRKSLCERDKVVEEIKERDFEILITLGAGDIDKQVGPIENFLKDKFKKV